MLGPRYSSLFKSRWMALLWGVLICLTAIQFVGTDAKDGSVQEANGDAAGEPLSAGDVATIRRAIGE